MAKPTEAGLLDTSRVPLHGREGVRVKAAVGGWLTRGPNGSLWPILALYTVVSVAYWGLPILGHWTTRTVGSGTDPLNIFVWSMAWWPYALTHGINPLILNKVFVPVVTNAGWCTLVPLLSVAAAPLTLTAGPVASYNAAMLLAPPLTATMTYLLMSEFVSKRWVALWAGYMVGFSTYEVSQTLEHLHLTFAALVPLALWLGVRLYRTPPRWGYIAALSAVLVGQFLISTEVLLTFSLFGLGGVGLAWLILPEQRKRIARLIGWVLAAYGPWVVVLSPWLWMMVQHIPFQNVGNAYAANSTNLLNLVLPTPATIGGEWFRSLSLSFSAGSRTEASGYLGIPLLALAGWASWRLRRISGARVVMYVGLAALVLTLGPVLQVGWWRGPSLPWRMLSQLPVLEVVSTTRFILYVSLIGTGLVAWAVSRIDVSSRVLPVTLCLAAVALVPNLSRPGWWGSAAVPRLITSPSLLRREVAPGEVVMVFPYFDTGPSTYWQAASGFRLTLADGYLYSGLSRPFDLLQLPALLVNHQVPLGSSAARQLDVLLRMSRVGVVLVQQPAPATDVSLLRRAGLVRKGVVGGVGVWSVPKWLRGRPESASSLFRMALTAKDEAEVRDLVTIANAAQRYVKSGRPMAKLTLGQMEHTGFLTKSQGHSESYLGWQQTVWQVLFRPSPPHGFVMIVPSITEANFGRMVRRLGHVVVAHQFVAVAPLSASQPVDMRVGNGVLTFRLPAFPQ